MKRIRSCLAASFLLGLTAGAGGRAGPQQPVFRAGVEIFHIDVSVIDRNRQPVRGLTTADFTLLEDGKPQKIVALAPIDVPDPEPPSAVWMRDVTPDVSTNAVRDRRIVVIVMDDAMVVTSPIALTNAPKIAHDVIDRLGPEDLAAVVFCRDNRFAQEFTNDHAKLKTAVDHFSMGFGGGGPMMYWEQASADALSEAARILIAIPDKRKALVYISSGISVPPVEAPLMLVDTRTVVGPRENVATVQQRITNIFKQAERSNVNVYPFDICGLRPLMTGRPPDPCRVNPVINEFFLAVAENTGGHATLNTNDFKPGITRMFQENSSYYIVGYESTNQKGGGHYRRLEVKVDRPDVEVRSRSIYYAEKPEDPPKPDKSAVSPLMKSLSGLTPDDALPLSVSVAPFAMPDKPGSAAVAAIVRIDQPLPAGAPVSAASRIENVQMLVTAFDPEGRPRGSQNVSARVVVRPREGRLRYEVLARAELKPGRYQLRFATNNAAMKSHGSVFADVEVPDFAKTPLSMSGVLLAASPPSVSSPRDALSSLVPVFPTAGRDFGRAEHVSAFLRVYQGGDTERPPAAVDLAIRIRDEHDKVVVDEPRPLAADAFSAARAVDLTYDLPLERLAAGQYLLTIEAKSGEKNIARRDVRFVVR